MNYRHFCILQNLQEVGLHGLTVKSLLSKTIVSDGKIYHIAQNFDGEILMELTFNK